MKNRTIHRFEIILIVTTALALAACAPSNVPSTLPPGSTPHATSAPTSKASLPVVATVFPKASATKGPTATPVRTATLLPTVRPTRAIPTAPAAALVPEVFKMIDAHIGWGVESDLLLRTTDGGRVWVDVTPPDVERGELLTSEIFNANTAWVLTPSALDFTAGVLYHTVDGGENWESAQAPFGEGRIQAIDAQNLVAIANRGVALGSHAVDFYVSEDAGATWEQVYHTDPEQAEANSLPFAGNKSGMFFSDPYHGWVTGFIPVDGETFLYKTEDGGHTWQPQALPIPPAFSKAQIMLLQPVFFNSSDGLISANLALFDGSVTSYYLAFFVTTDGGITWSLPNQEPLQASGVISMMSVNDIFVYNGVNLYVSSSGGNLYIQRTPNIALGGEPACLQFVDSNTGWLTNSDGVHTRLYMTADAGKTWVLLTSN